MDGIKESNGGNVDSPKREPRDDKKKTGTVTAMHARTCARLLPPVWVLASLVARSRSIVKTACASSNKCPKSKPEGEYDLASNSARRLFSLNFEGLARCTGLV